VKPLPSSFDAVFETPFGALGICVDATSVTRLEFLGDDAVLMNSSHPLVAQLNQALQAYLRDPRASFDIPCGLQGTPFQQRVWRAIADIPAGRTLTYAQLAEKVGSGPRAVANACGANPLPLIIPCHRVVARTGLGGFMRGRRAAALSIKTWLLRHESAAGTA